MKTNKIKISLSLNKSVISKFGNDHGDIVRATTKTEVAATCWSMHDFLADNPYFIDALSYGPAATCTALHPGHNDLIVGCNGVK